MGKPGGLSEISEAQKNKMLNDATYIRNLQKRSTQRQRVDYKYKEWRAGWRENR